MSDENKDVLTEIEEPNPESLSGIYFSKMAGSPFENEAFGEIARDQLLNLLGNYKDPKTGYICDSHTLQKLTDQFTILIKGINPQDQIEGMLAIKMIGIHYAAMDCLEKAKDSKYLDLRESYLNFATKLSRTFTMQMEALNRHRGKGQQKMTVEHVHVNAGGQAIIGTVQSHRKEKKDIGGSKPKNEN